MSTDNKGVYAQNVIILRSVYGKVGMKYFIQPCKDKQGRYPDCVKHVNSQGDMIMSDQERNSEASKYFIPENKTFVITDGQSYNLDDPYDKNIWEAIKNCEFIALSRYAKDVNGNNLIDGTMGWDSKKPRYGVAELYVDMPGVESVRKVSKKKKILQASEYILTDERGSEGRVLIARLLGKHMKNMPDADVEDYLLTIAEKNPDKIISLYSGSDTTLRILFMDALDKKIIVSKNKIYCYGDNIYLGATDDAVITWMKDPKHRKILDMIRKDTYPEMYNSDDESAFTGDKIHIDEGSLDEKKIEPKKIEEDPVIEKALHQNRGNKK